MAAADGANQDAERARRVAAALMEALAGVGDVAAWLAPGVVLTMSETEEVTRGRAAVAALLLYLHRQAFTASPIVRAIAAEPRQAVVEAEFVGTHVGEFAGAAPTGREVRIAYALACEVGVDAISAIRLYLSLDALLRQVR